MKTLRLACCVWIALAACASGKAAVGERTLRYLDAQTRELTQPVERADAGRRFVRVEVAEVVNPRLHAAIFELHYQPAAGERIHIGDFSLYPANRPGTFLVATKGRVKSEGALVLVLRSTHTIERDDPIRVGIGRIELSDK